MIVHVRSGSDAGRVRKALVELGLWVKKHDDGERTFFFVEPWSTSVDPSIVRAIDGVESVAIAEPAAPRVLAQNGPVRVRDVLIGAGLPPVAIAGPCSVESRDHVRALADALAASGARILRGGAFKPRTSPYSFQGHGARALAWLREAADANGMAVVTEVMAVDQIDAVAEHADLVQIGSRNMHDYALLCAVGAAEKPVLLKRGMAATVEEWLAAGEYCLVHGAPGVVLCERGIRGFDPSTRNVLDLGAVALLTQVHRLPVVVDPSHASGRRDLIPTLARAAIAAGASGLMIETHDAPGDALSDGPQALATRELADLLAELGTEERPCLTGKARAAASPASTSSPSASVSTTS